MDLGYAVPARAGLPSGRRGSWWRWLLPATLVAIAAVNGLDFPLSVPRLRALSGGQTLLDLRPGYGPEDAYRLLDALGVAGRLAYLRMLWTVDLVLPALFSAFLWSAVSAGALRRWRWMTLLPGAVDYVENAAISALLVAYPARWNAVAWLASAATAVKLSTYLASLAIAVGGAVLARMRTQGRLASPPVAEEVP
jgi:hypothetical protein